MNTWRIVSWFSGFILALLAFRYMPSWRECAVFMVFYSVSAVCNMRVGQLMFAGDK